MNGMTRQNTRVLVVDDEPAILASFREVLCGGPRRAPASARLASLEHALFGGDAVAQPPTVDLVTRAQADQGVEAVRQAMDQGEPFAVAFVDVRMPPGPDGVWAVREIRALDQDVEIVVMTAYTDIAPNHIAQMAPPAGKLLYLQKPFHAHELRQLVASLADKWLAQRELELARSDLERRVVERTAQLAAANRQLQDEMDQRKAKERELADSEKSLRLILEHLPMGVLVIDQRDAIRRVNPAALRLLAYEDESELLGADCSVICGQEADHCPFGHDQGEFEGREGVVIDKLGRRVPVLRSIVRIPLEGESLLIEVFSDQTERKRAEREKRQMEGRIRQAQKMEALGSLAGGVAHDFNNILNAVIGFTELAARELDESAKAKEYLRHVLLAGRRAADLASQILTFSRGGELEKRPIQVTTIVKEVLKLLRASLPSTIEIRQNIQQMTEVILADPSQIHQVMMNLCTNAAQAMGEGGGVLETEVRKMVLDRPLWLAMAELPPGPYAVIRVADSGPGIAPDDLPRIFEPYFSTKMASGGTGLGLAVVHGIVKSLGGAIDVQSTPGAGCQFSVYLPIPEASASETVAADGPLPLGHETILLVDDEPELVQLGRSILEVLGYQVDGATDPGQALALFSADPKRYDLLFTDQTMPKMTGLELARRMRLLRADLPVVLCTGYGEKVSAQALDSDVAVRMVLKPVLMSELAMAVRQALDGVAESPKN